MPIQHQQEPPVWGVVKKKSLFSAKQLNCDTAELWGSPGVRPSHIRQLLLTGLVCPAVVWSPLIFSALLPAQPLWPGLVCSALVRHLGGMQSSLERGKYALRAKGALAYIDRSPYPWSLIGLSSCLHLSSSFSRLLLVFWIVWFHMNFSFLKISVKNAIGILIRSTLNLYILWVVWIF